MRNFGNAHSGYLQDNPRYRDFLKALKERMQRLKKDNRAQIIINYMYQLGAGKSPKEARRLTKGRNFAAPLKSEYDPIWQQYKDMRKTVSYFAQGPDDTSGPLLDADDIAKAQGSYATRSGQLQSLPGLDFEGGGQGGDAAAFMGDEEPVGFIEQYRTPLLIGSALAVAGGASYYFFFVRGK